MPYFSACTLDCQDACSTIVKKAADGSVTVTGNPDHPFTRGRICAKGRRAVDRRINPRRITTPLIRSRGRFYPADWDTALDRVAGKISRCRQTPESMVHVRHYGYRGVFAEASNYLFNRLGARPTRGSLCDEAGIAACMADFGAMEMNDPAQLMNAGGIVNWGKDFSRSSLHLAEMVQTARRRGCRVTTISPGGDDNHRLSDHTIRIRPGTDRFLAAAVIKRLVRDGLISAETVSRVSGWNRFLSVIAAYDTKALLSACGSSPGDLERLAAQYADPGGPVASIMGWAIQRYVNGAETVRYINALAMLSGQLGIAGGGSYYNISSGRNLNTAWASRGGRPGPSLLLPRIGRELLAADPAVQFLLADGTNFVNQAPDSTTTAAALARIPFKVVVDAFMTDTARLADVILPCALDLEREEIVGSCLHNVVNYAGAVVAPAGQARCDFDIMADLAGRLGIGFPARDEILEQALDRQWLETGTGGDSPSGQLKKKGFVTTAHPDIAWKDLNFAHADGRYHLPDALTAAPNAPEGYPLHLLSLVNGRFLHSQIPEEEQTGPPVLWINPDSPGLAALDPSKPVFVATRLGRLAVQLEMLNDLHPLAVIVRRGGWIHHGRCVNPLVEPRLTDMGETAAYYSQYCRLEN